MQVPRRPQRTFLVARGTVPRKPESGDEAESRTTTLLRQRNGINLRRRETSGTEASASVASMTNDSRANRSSAGYPRKPEVESMQQWEHAVAEQSDAAGRGQPLRRPEFDPLRTGLEQ